MPDYVVISIRAVLAYFTLFAVTRLMGKREISQMTFFDYIVGITIGSITANMAINTTNSFTTILPALLVFGFFQILTAYISLKNRSFRKLFDGSKTMLIRNGKILERNLLKERINVDELSTKLREKNVFKLADVEFAYLEPDGKFSVMKKTDKQPVTPYDMGLRTQYSGVGHLVVEEGIIIEHVLRNQGLTVSWLMDKLSQKGIYDLSKVMFAQVDESGKLYIDTYENFDEDIRQSTSQQMTLVKLTKIESDLLAFYNDTNDKEAKKMYKECANKINFITLKYKNYLNQNKIIT